jgi:hypothetical protein
MSQRHSKKKNIFQVFCTDVKVGDSDAWKSTIFSTLFPEDQN